MAAEDFFDNQGGGGAGAPSFDWRLPGERTPRPGPHSRISGEIVDQFETVQRAYGDPNKILTWDDGTPRPQLNVTLKTSLRNWERVKSVPTDDHGNPLPPQQDTGLRRIYVKGDMPRAIAAALRQTPSAENNWTGKGTTQGGLEKGDKLAVWVRGFEDKGKGNPLTLYEAAYKVNPNKETAGYFEENAPAAQAPQYQAPPPPPPPPADPWATPAPPPQQYQAPPAQQPYQAPPVQQAAPQQAAPAYSQDPWDDAPVAPTSPPAGGAPSQAQTVVDEPPF